MVLFEFPVSSSGGVRMLH